MKILVTGAAGFIGAAVSRYLLNRGEQIVGIDNLNSYYDVSLKEARLELLKECAGFRFQLLDITDRVNLFALFENSRFDKVVHLAAQAGVRYSIENPYAYIDSNIYGFLNILEACRHFPVEHLVFASSSSVYGANAKLPFSVSDNADHPVSLYGATKKSNELMAHSYCHLYNLVATGLRFFTVYGPWGRPDMSIFKFTKNIIEGNPIEIYNFGNHRRDFTYIDDIVKGVVRVLDKPPSFDQNKVGENDPSSSSVSYRLYNIGNNSPVHLDELIQTLEAIIGKQAKRNLVAMQQGDVLETYADIDALQENFDFRPKTSIYEGVNQFVNWYKEFYKVAKKEVCR